MDKLCSLLFLYNALYIGSKCLLITIASMVTWYDEHKNVCEARNPGAQVEDTARLGPCPTLFVLPTKEN